MRTVDACSRDRRSDGGAVSAWVAGMELQDWHFVFVWPGILLLAFGFFVCTRTDEDRREAARKRHAVAVKRAVD